MSSAVIADQPISAMTLTCKSRDSTAAASLSSGAIATAMLSIGSTIASRSGCSI